MKRRDYIKTIMLGSIIPMTNKTYGFSNLINSMFEGPTTVNFKSNWHNWSDMKWAGPEYWGNRLQDWMITDGKLVCDVTGHNRNLHLLTIQNSKGNIPLNVSVTVDKLNEELNNIEEGYVGFLLGAKGSFEDYRSAAVFGKGLEVGLTPKGNLKVGSKEYATELKTIPQTFKLAFSNQLNDGKYAASVKVLSTDDTILFEQKGIELAPEDLKGNIALSSSFGKRRSKTKNIASVAFSNWEINSSELYSKEDNLFGPICFAQYTLNKGILKLTAQFTPIENIPNHKILLEFNKNGVWTTQQETKVENAGRAINFKVSDWAENTDTPYRIVAKIPVGNETHHYIYEGTIAAEPKDKENLNIAVFSCNAHYGFPDQDIPDSLKKLDYDLSLFLGDQFYEGTGGFGADYSGEFDKTCLDYLRKWMMFGWSYRDIFRHKPCAIIPDDHDVYHGNVWGEEGKKADVSKGYGSAAQDSGGFKMKTDWVNMVQFTQTSHLPDAYDPTPVKNNIGVYYTSWNYAGVSFAFLEDRKFKSAPLNVLPKEADVFNGFIRNPEFDIKKHRDIDAELLGKRQEKFLEEWVEDWSEDSQVKILCSQTNFATIATLPKGSKSDSVVPSLHIPEKGEYIKGDAPTSDMDSNGWPQNKRDKALEIIRKGFVFHIAGDQHLGTFIQYGINKHGDSGFAFTGPALNNLWPRRFWPDIDATNHTYENPAYTGDFEDGFGNKMTVKAVANPHNQHLEPKILHNRANGFGMVSVNKTERTITSSCYQRFKDVEAADAQYPGWPITVTQEDQLFTHAEYQLPKLEIESKNNLTIRVLNKNKELVYSIPAAGKTFRPKVFEKGKYTVEVALNNEVLKTLKLKTTNSNSKKVKVRV